MFLLFPLSLDKIVKQNFWNQVTEVESIHSFRDILKKRLPQRILLLGLGSQNFRFRILVFKHAGASKFQFQACLSLLDA